MTKKELILFSEMYATFKNDCKRVCNILKRFEPAYKFLDTFELIGNVVAGSGVEHWCYDDYDEHHLHFDAAYLTMTDEELNKMVDELVEEKEQEKISEERKHREQEECERKLLKELKEKYEGK